MKKLFLIAMAALSFGAFAGPRDGGPAPECDGVKIASGPAGKGYSKIFRNIEAVCGKTVPVCEVQSKGGMDNLDILASNSADMGIATLATMKTMQGDESYRALQVVGTLHGNFLHTLVATNGFSVQGAKKLGFLKGDVTQVVINRFSDLKGHTVAVVGSALPIVVTLNKNAGLGMNIVEVDKDGDAIKGVQSGQYAAAFIMTAWKGSDAINGLSDSSGVTLAPFDGVIAAPYTVRSMNYPKIRAYNVNMLGDQNLLITRPFKGEKASQVAALKACLVKNLDRLQEGNFEPGWNEIKSLDGNVDWTKFNGVAKKTK